MCHYACSRTQWLSLTEDNGCVDVTRVGVRRAGRLVAAPGDGPEPGRVGARAIWSPARQGAGRSAAASETTTASKPRSWARLRRSTAADEEAR